MKKFISLLIINLFNLIIIGNVFWYSGGGSCTTEKITNATNFIYSSDWKNTFYILTKDNGKQVLVKDWIEGREYDNIISNLTYLIGSNSIFYIAKKDNGKQVLVKGWVESKEYDNIPDLYIKYSEDGKNFAYIWINWDNSSVLVKDWVENDKYNFITDIKYSPNYNSFAYIAKKNNEKQVLVKDWVESKEYEHIYEFIYSSDSEHFAFKTLDTLIVDWIENNNPYKIKDFDFFYNPEIFRNYLDNLTGNVTHNRSYIYSTDKKSSAYVDFAKWNIVKDWVPIKDAYFYINEKMYIPNTNSIVLVINNGDNTYSILKDWIKMKKYSKYNYINNVLFSSDGNSMAFTSTDKNWNFIVVKDWLESEWFIDYPVYLYSPDGRSFTYIWKKDNGKVVVIKDWVKISEYDWLITDYIYSPDSKSFIYRIFNKWKYLIIKDWIILDKYEDLNKGYDFIPFNGKYSPDWNTFVYSILGNWKWWIVKEICNQGNNSEIDTSNILNKINKTKPQLFKQLILSKKELNKTFKWRKNISTIDLIVQKLSKQKLEKLMLKLKKIDTSLVIYKKYKDMLDYLESKVWLELLKQKRLNK